MTGNDELTPETGENWDTGMVLSGKPLPWVSNAFVEAVYHEREVDNLILFFPNSQYTTKPVNIGAAKVRGWEWSAAANIGGTVDVQIHYARLRTTDVSEVPFYNGNTLPSHPKNDLSVSTHTTLGPTAITYEYHYLGENFLDLANFSTVPARRIHNASATWFTRLSGLGATLEIQNITGNQVSDIAGYPLPGRAFFATIHYRR